MRSRFARLSAQDLTSLAVEAVDTPMHVGILAVLDGAPLLDLSGDLRTAEIDARLAAGLRAAPILRQVVHRGGWLTGRPVWVDDPDFSLDRHVEATAVPSPGDEQELLRLVERLMQPVLDRSRPLWRVWLVTGLSDGRIALVVKVHHALADGLAAMRLVTTLLGRPPVAVGAEDAFLPQPPPTWVALARDNREGTLRDTRVALSALGRIETWAHARASARSAWTTMRQAKTAPRSSLNVPIGPRRRLAAVRLDLAEAKRIGSRYGATVNDVVLNLAAGGLRALLVSRGEPVAGLVLHAGVAAANRSADDVASTGNRAGVIVVRLPLEEPDPASRLPQIVAATTAAKRDQTVLGEQAFMVFLARTRLMRPVTRHQHLTNIVESNLLGPATPITVLGATALDVLPIGVVAGNLAIAFLAFSYAGALSISVWCDGDAFPDLDVAVEAMRDDWNDLLGLGTTAR